MKALLLSASLCLPGVALANFDRQIWDGLLKRNVVQSDDGKASGVRYAAIAEEHDVFDAT